MADFWVDSPRHGGYPPFLHPPDPPADQADIRRGWADSPIIFSLQSSQSPGRYYCAWLPCAPFCYIYIITMRAGSQTKRQRRNKRTSPTSSENNSTESENGILQNHCINNIKTISKDNSENALLCSLLRRSTYYFFVALQANTLSYQNL